MSSTNEMINLGHSANGYLRRCLSHGAGLSALAAGILDEGQVFALVPEGTTCERAGDLTTGGLLSRKDGLQWLAEYICHKLKPKLRVLAQDVWLGPQDRTETTNCAVAILHSRNALYYEMKSGQSCEDGIDLLARETSSALFVAFLMRVPEELQADANSAVPEQPELINEIFLSAYDQESFVVWRRTECGGHKAH